MHSGVAQISLTLHSENKMTVEKQNIREITTEEIAQFLTSKGEKAFRAKQIRQWIWQKGVHSFDEMTNLPKSTRELLAGQYIFDSLTADRIQSATDGTTKTAWRLHDGNYVESVLIPGNDRYTVCVSSQAGCQLGCSFCATGTLGFKRNLTPGEIFDQVVAAREEAEKRESQLSNIVFMGMGELRQCTPGYRPDYSGRRPGHVAFPHYRFHSRYSGQNPATGRR